LYYCSNKFSCSRSSATSTALVSGIVNSAPHVASGGEISGRGTTAATNSPIPIPGVTSTALILVILHSAPHVASGGEAPGSGTTALILGIVNSAPCVASGGEALIPGSTTEAN
jgi:hypothetical protein